MKKIGFLLPVLAFLAAGDALARETTAAATVAATVLTNGKVYTLDPGQRWAEAVAIKSGKISFVGSSEEALQYRGGDTEVIDLGGKMVLPGTERSPRTSRLRFYRAAVRMRVPPRFKCR